MALLVDTSVLIDIERRRVSLAVLAPELEGGEVLAVASMTISELLIGAHYAAADHQRQMRREFVERVLAETVLFDFDLAAASVYAELYVQLRQSGSMVGAHDLIIAATALAQQASVLTGNFRDFSRIPGLEVRQPAW